MRKSIILLVFLLVACGGAEAEAVAPKAETIVCTVAYRPSVSQPIEREEMITFTDNDAEQTIAFDEMTFHAAYSAGEADNERNLRVWVTDAEDETAVYQVALYQLPVNSGPQNQFVGGHGFTGLNYSYQPDSTAEMQFWCEVGGR